MGIGREEQGGDRHWAGRGKTIIDAGDEYLAITGGTELDSTFVVSTAIKPPDAKKFHELENQPLTPLRQIDLIRLAA